MKIILVLLLLMVPILDACPKKPDFVWLADPPTVINVGQQIQLEYKTTGSIQWRVERIAPGGGPDVTNFFIDGTGKITGIQAGGVRHVYAITNTGKVVVRFDLTCQ